MLLISNRLAGLIVAVILLLVSYNMIFCESKAVSGNMAQLPALGAIFNMSQPVSHI